MSIVLTVMTEWLESPLWVSLDGDVRTPYGFDEISEVVPVDEALRQDFAAWDDEFQANFRQDDPASSGFASEELEQGFYARGRLLAQRLRRSVDPSITVEYAGDGHHGTEAIAFQAPSQAHGYAYAEVYVEAARETTAAAVSAALEFQRDANSASPLFHDDLFELDFRRNPDPEAPPREFTGYPTVIEIASRDGAEHREIISLVEQVVSIVRTHGHWAFAVADFESELAPTRPKITYYAKLHDGHTRSNPSGILRRRTTDGISHDEAFTRNLRWEPTEYLRRYGLGHDDIDHVEITKREADAFIARMSTSGRE